MPSNKTSILLILDRSGSMSSLHNDLIGGINSFIEEQRKLTDECEVSIISFDNEPEELFWNVPLSFVKTFDVKKDFVPRGSTALYDAIGCGVDKLGEKLAALPEEQRPKKVITVIYTDGEENASRKVRHSQIAEKIKHQQEVYNWDFVFLGANQDAILTAKNLNINYNSSMTYSASTSGMLSSFTGLSMYCSGTRTVGTGYFSPEIRTAALAV